MCVAPFGVRNDEGSARFGDVAMRLSTGKPAAEHFKQVHRGSLTLERMESRVVLDAVTFEGASEVLHTAKLDFEPSINNFTKRRVPVLLAAKVTDLFVPVSNVEVHFHHFRDGQWQYILNGGLHPNSLPANSDDLATKYFLPLTPNKAGMNIPVPVVYGAPSSEVFFH